MKAVIRPGTARGSVAVPPSKSMAHRLLICAALAEGESVVRGVDPSEDILATLDCVEALGAGVSREGSVVRIRGCDPRKAASAVLRCRESGSTLRFMIPLCLLSGCPMSLEGSPTLLGRPLSVYETVCRERGLRFERCEDALCVEGVLTPGDYVLPGNVSSQFVTGLLFALPLLPAGSVLRLIPPVESRSYLNLTLSALRTAGISPETPDENTFRIPGNSVYRPVDTVVEGDYSNAAFFMALNCLGGSVHLTGLNPQSLQGDRVCERFLPLLRDGSPVLDLSDCPDLAPVLFAVAALCHGAVFTGTRRLRFKESDRGAAMAEELAKFGVSLRLEENSVTVTPGELRVPDAPLSSHNDHRIAMALSLLCSCTGGEIRCAEAVCKSFPDYWLRLQALGIPLSLESEDM